MTGARTAADRDEDARGVALVLVSAIAYGTLPILGKLAYAGGFKPAPLLAVRFLVATPIFALLAFLSRRPPLSLGQRLRLWGLGVVFVGNTFAYFMALETVPAATVALLLYGYPVIVTLLSAAIGLEGLTLRAVLAAVLAFAGCALTAGGRVESGPGVVYALVAAVVYASYIVLGSRFAADVPAEAAALHVSQVCAVFYVGWALAQGGNLPADPKPWLHALALAIVPTVIALRTFLAGLARIGPARSAVLSSVEVLVTMVLSFALLGERLPPRQWAGGLLILGAVAFQNLRGR